MDYKAKRDSFVKDADFCLKRYIWCKHEAKTKDDGRRKGAAYWLWQYRGNMRKARYCMNKLEGK